MAMLDMGAYQEVSAGNFNALPRPAALLINGSAADLIRRAETMAEIFQREIIPERLQHQKAAVRQP